LYTTGFDATVGADFTGEYYVGLGSTVEKRFRAFLAKIAVVDNAKHWVAEVLPEEEDA